MFSSYQRAVSPDFIVERTQFYFLGVFYYRVLSRTNIRCRFIAKSYCRKVAQYNDAQQVGFVVLST